MHQDLAYRLIGVTEASALATFDCVGRGDEHQADQVAVDAMRGALNQLPIKGEVVIGEGERDHAPMLYVGEKVGQGVGIEADLALDPLEGTTLTAKGHPGALSVLALGRRGTLLKAPDVYMEKMAVGPGVSTDLLHLDMPVYEKLSRLSGALDKPISKLTVCVLERPRHQGLIQDIRLAGAKIALIGDGDVSGAIATCQPERGIDLYLGVGGAPEGVLAAAALKCLGGWMQGRLLFQTPDQRSRANQMGLRDLEAIYPLGGLVKDDVLFCVTGVTSGALLQGVRLEQDKLFTQTLLLCSQTGVRRTVCAQHPQQKTPS